MNFSACYGWHFKSRVCYKKKYILFPRLNHHMTFEVVQWCPGLLHEADGYDTRPTRCPWCSMIPHQSQAVEDRPSARCGSSFMHLNSDLCVALSMQGMFLSFVVNNDLKLDTVVPTQAIGDIINAIGHLSWSPVSSYLRNVRLSFKSYLTASRTPQMCPVTLDGVSIVCRVV